MADITRRFYAPEGPAVRKGLHCLGPAETRLISQFLNFKTRTVASRSIESRRNTGCSTDWLGEVILDEEPRPDDVTARSQSEVNPNKRGIDATLIGFLHRSGLPEIRGSSSASVVWSRYSPYTRRGVEVDGCVVSKEGLPSYWTLRRRRTPMPRYNPRLAHLLTTDRMLGVWMFGGCHDGPRLVSHRHNHLLSGDTFFHDGVLPRQERREGCTPFRGEDGVGPYGAI